MRSLITPLLLISSLASFSCHANKYPDRPIRLIVASAAGGGNDFVARAISQKVSQELGQPLVIENKGGAAGLVASNFVAKSNPDGYTLLLVFANFATFPSLGRKLSFDPGKDLIPVSNIATTPLVLMAPTALPVKSVGELIQFAKKERKTLDYASPGVGSMGHLAAALFEKMAHIKMNHIPYKGGGPAIMALLTGEVQLFFSTLPAAMPQLTAGRLQALGITSSKRSAFAPNIPTISESGLPGYEVDGWVGLFTPAGTPEAIVNSIYKAFSDAVKDKNVQTQFSKEGVSPLGNTPAEFSRQLRKDVEKWKPFIQTLDANPN
ncbi:tripartite tricarboxylate transporter substrate binding protein [Paralcaligenes ureilyticus]|uniref:Tripartite-type tricarboxylate transporter receptor subunit TctC n=1 Tax=Paralcaligenes ureilyticus TaxID=627131 RepID=A0A4R3M915_9BURK|nr:tripartite tricarboxylate transporter substrate binding protein [Paralcaligenes ureilyticus]TCT09602.1 tripartite-type tricarboxylate transporter receptor subunit TctC [Paralcaligenes ureilyticus]